MVTLNFFNIADLHARSMKVLSYEEYELDQIKENLVYSQEEKELLLIQSPRSISLTYWRGWSPVWLAFSIRPRHVSMHFYLISPIMLLD